MKHRKYTVSSHTMYETTGDGKTYRLIHHRLEGGKGRIEITVSEPGHETKVLNKLSYVDDGRHWAASTTATAKAVFWNNFNQVVRQRWGEA